MQPIDLSHQGIITEAFSKLSMELSEYTFANLYLFRHVHEYCLCQDNELFIRGKTYDGKFFLMPTSVESIKSKKDLLPNKADFFFPVPENWLSGLDPALFTYRNEDSDYIYEVDAMSHYPGRHLSKKRNLTKQFFEFYNEIHQEPLSCQKDAAKKILDKWQKHGHIESDYQACMEAITLLETLKLEGQVYFVGEVPVGFIIGEAVNPEMFVMHFAKADIEYRGVYQYMNQAFAQVLQGRYKWINMEQDLGLPELRQSKHSYQPARECKKFRLLT